MYSADSAYPSSITSANNTVTTTTVAEFKTAIPSTDLASDPSC